ncbi:DUF2249 domain-containing protein [sulfur-oxidizing endosymbiont of Gigantopelta aegis]|uniref:DUF2249 domain-containing protein n=1 Tax=sulfur-oxidizing endosymbiont of Gigantopelta aegis TaxID=2794934 RepID=UPI0018DC7E6C|nr:DUF2249 domain-containing protein [sulfur-oxidizing endosymbiont of Gigantopelta aegis]
MNELFIDVSDYDPPEPFEAVIALLRKMKRGDYIRMLHRKKPLPLFQLLQEQGFDYRLKESLKESSNKTVNEAIAQSESSKLWTIIIWKKNDIPVNDYCIKHF